MATTKDILNAIALVQVYIHIHRGVEVEITIDPSSRRDLELLQKALNKATDYFKLTKAKINHAPVVYRESRTQNYERDDTTRKDRKGWFEGPYGRWRREN